MNDKLLTLLGFASKARRLSYGASASLEAAAAKKSKVILICNDISPKSRKEILFKCGKYGTLAIVLQNYDIKTLSGAVGRSCGVISVNDSSFANEAIKLTTNGGNANEQ